MRNYQNKSNAGALPDSITTTKFGAGEFNSIATELENAVTTSGQTLAPADGTGEVTDQLAMTLAIYGAGGAFYHADTGAVNAYVLTPISPKESPPAYFDGFTVIFEPGTVNTSASTVNVNSLGVKNITYSSGNALSGGELSGSCGIKYNLTDDRFELLFSSAGLAGLSRYYVVDETQADQGAASANANTLTIFDVAALVGTSKNATVYLKHNPAAGNQTLYTFDTSLNLSSYPNLFILFDPGAQINRTTGDEIFTVHSSGNILADVEQQLTSVAMLAFFYPSRVPVGWFGADRSGDDSTAIQNAINAAGAGVTVFEAGFYNADSLTLSTNGGTIEGKSSDATFIRSNSANVNILTISGQRNVVRNIGFSNPYVPSISSVALIKLNGTVECIINNVLGIGGFFSLFMTGGGSDNVVSSSKFYDSYGGAICLIQNCSGSYLRRLKLDQSWPVQKPVTADFMGAWAATTAYAVGNIITSGGYYYQCKTAGTSGGAFPGIQPFNTDIADGTVVWLLACAVGSASLVIDSNSFYTVVQNCDHTGAFDAGILLSNSLATNGPQKVIIRHTEIGETVAYGIRATAGAGIYIGSGCTISSPVTSNTNGIYLQGATGDVNINDVLLYGFQTGIFVNSGDNTIITSCQVYGCSLVAILIVANINNFMITNNMLGVSATWGANAAAVIIQPGTSDYYHIVNNNVQTLTISDGGTGVNKTVGNNH